MAKSNSPPAGKNALAPIMKKMDAKKSVKPAKEPIGKKPLPEERKWKAEDAIGTIMRAEMHKQDQALMNDIKAVAAEKMHVMKKICK